jgi:mRNA-degrading endonuclease toxin of MazEF toxin-antitoxin module
MAIEKGDIYWVVLTGHGSEQNGRRPCIVMSRKVVNDALKTVLIVPMTTNMGSPHPAFRIRLPLADFLKNPACTSTLQDSIAKCDQVRVLDQSLLESKIGRLTATAIAAVELGIAYVLDIR